MISIIKMKTIKQDGFTAIETATGWRIINPYDVVIATMPKSVYPTGEAAIDAVR